MTTGAGWRLMFLRDLRLSFDAWRLVSFKSKITAICARSVLKCSIQFFQHSATVSLNSTPK